jgi:glycosyltransferase involved in cell wall biosynthesis
MNIMFQVGSWHYDKGGTDIFVKTLSYWLAKKGHKVVFLAHRLLEEDCEDEDIPSDSGDGIIKVRYTPKQKTGVRFNPIIYANRLLKTSKLIYYLAKKERISNIIVGEPELISTLPLKFSKTKIICRGGALMYETMSKEVKKEIGNTPYSKFFNTLIKIYNNITLKLPDILIPVNSSEYNFLNSKKRKSARILTIPHGIPINIFKPKKRKSKDKITIGYVGRLAPIKYPELALNIFKQASHGVATEFHWIGPLDPSFQEDHLEKLKSKLGIKNAKYFGQISNSELPKYLNNLDIFLQVEQQKNVSRSTTEAAACGLPIVALNHGSEPYGFFSMDLGEVTLELTKLINNKPYRLASGKKAREIIEKSFSEDKIYQTYLNLFQQEGE